MRAKHLKGSVFSGLLVLLLMMAGVLLLSGSAKAAYPAATTAQSEAREAGEPKAYMGRSASPVPKRNPTIELLMPTGLPAPGRRRAARLR